MLTVFFTLISIWYLRQLLRKKVKKTNLIISQRIRNYWFWELFLYLCYEAFLHGNFKIVRQREGASRVDECINKKKTTFFAICFYCFEVEVWIFRRLWAIDLILGYKFQLPANPEKRFLTHRQTNWKWLDKGSIFSNFVFNPKNLKDTFIRNRKWTILEMTVLQIFFKYF